MADEQPELDKNLDEESPLAAAAAAKRRKKNLVNASVAVGIGSAAIVAALLYSNRSRRGPKDI